MAGLLSFDVEGGSGSVVGIPSGIVTGGEGPALLDDSKAGLELGGVLELIGGGIVRVVSLGALVVLPRIGSGECSENISVLHSSIEEILFQHYRDVYY